MQLSYFIYTQQARLLLTTLNNVNEWVIDDD